MLTHPASWLGCLVAAAAPALPAAQSVPPPALEISATLDDRGECVFHVGGRAMTMAELLKTLKNDPTGREAVFAGAETPYRCLGEAIFAAQTDGLRIGFISEPPPRGRAKRR